MDIRPYQPSDRDACLAVFDSNVPAFFRLDERPDFEAFLGALNCTYLVMEHEARIVGCGGFYRTEELSLARLCYGMIHRDLHRQGLGRFLLLFRLREIGKWPGVERVGLSTTLLTAPFFASQGFKSDGAPQDRVEMRMKLTVCP